MRQITIKANHSHTTSPEWNDTQTERQQKGIGLELALLSCSCAADSLLLIEHGQLQDVWAGRDDLSEISVETLHVTCPACGATTNISVPAINKYDGAQVRVLESWSTNTTMTGLPDTILDNNQTLRIAASVKIPKFILNPEAVPLDDIVRQVTGQLTELVTRHICVAMDEARRNTQKPTDKPIFDWKP